MQAPRSFGQLSLWDPHHNLDPPPCISLGSHLCGFPIMILTPPPMHKSWFTFRSLFSGNGEKCGSGVETAALAVPSERASSLWWEVGHSRPDTVASLAQLLLKMVVSASDFWVFQRRNLRLINLEKGLESWLGGYEHWLLLQNSSLSRDWECSHDTMMR